MSIEDPQDVPEAWRPHFARRRIEFTFRDLDRATEGVALNTIRRALLGIGDPSKRVVGAISDALGITPDEFLATRSTVTGEQPTTSFVLPARADQLNRRERDAVLSIVNALLDARDRHAEQPATDTADPPPAAGAQGTQDQKILPEVPDHIYEKWRTPNAHGLRADPGHPWLKSKFEARRARENAEIEEYGATLPTVPDDSLEPRALARDVALFNFGDQRVMLPKGRERAIRDFADKIGVELDSDQTFAVKKRPWQEVEDEVAAALGRYLLQGDNAVKSADLIQFPSSTQGGSSAPLDLTMDDVLHLVAPPAGSQPDSLAASAHWPDGKEVTSDEYEGYKRWIADGTSDGWLQYRLMHQASIPAAADDRGAADEGESDRARREQDEAVEGSQDDE